MNYLKEYIQYFGFIVFVQMISLVFNIFALCFSRFIMENYDVIIYIITKYTIFTVIVLYFICLPLFISKTYIGFIEKNNDMRN